MVSFTGKIDTKGEYKSVATLTGVTFTSGKTYNMQIQNAAWLKLDDAEFHFKSEKFDYTAGNDDLKIKTDDIYCLLTILEK